MFQNKVDFYKLRQRLDCRENPHYISYYIMPAIVFGVIIGSLTNLWFFPILYVLAIVVPIILGMMGKIGFRWVLLWVAVVLLPVFVVLLILFGGAILALFKH